MSELVRHYLGTLTRMPFVNTPSAAVAQMLPLSTDNDFAVFAEFSSTESPVYLSIPEHYKMLSTLVAQACMAWPSITVLIRVSMPGGMRIPANLLTDQVLLVEDIDAELSKLQQQATQLLVINDRFSRIKVDNNDNSLALSLYGQHSWQTEDGWQAMLELLTNWGVVAQ